MPHIQVATFAAGHLLTSYFINILKIRKCSTRIPVPNDLAACGIHGGDLPFATNQGELRPAVFFNREAPICVSNMNRISKWNFTETEHPFIKIREQ